ncbi:TetR/AcrR family transcriptional regulator [Streptomyces sp. DSM 44915]|uniref:TetR/AcrR family transcriptional regulator n=1 Tax=Streptomyces chisholmiae TaxID=3075540 RepID=A0ABU2JPD1_9ACTN|nr:TetR/AcrR family transcriptional regulator [Streptomyces sp. DSM 44915]MDT0266840.1 TetR/AcrR family transcriptional regulator [Streptomyces sp. DSM 44915]
MTAPRTTTLRTARERARAEVTQAIKEEACRQLAAEGASKLSLRAVARELGMVSSALYRYFPGRDDLLTALIVDAYNALGDAVEQALAAGHDRDPVERWTAVCHAARDWAVAHPHEYALIYGTPVPGYAAPDDTSGPGVRLPLALVAVATAAQRAGRLGPPEGEPAPPEVLADIAPVIPEHAPELSEASVAALIGAWAQLLGLLSFEIFGQFGDVLPARRAFFAHTVTRLARSVGLRPAPSAGADGGAASPAG